MEPKNVVLNIRVSKTEKKKLEELARRLNSKEAPAFRYALHVALEATDKSKNPDALKNIVVIA